MTRITVDSVLPAEIYNRLLIDHDATEQSALIELKSQHVHALAKILAVQGVSDYVELHLQPRHIVLQEGEEIVYKPLVIPGSGADISVTIDIAKAVPCPNSPKHSSFPLMWMASSTGELVAYEYGAMQNGSGPRKLWISPRNRGTPLPRISARTCKSPAYRISPLSKINPA